MWLGLFVLVRHPVNSMTGNADGSRQGATEVLAVTDGARMDMAKTEPRNPNAVPAELPCTDHSAVLRQYIPRGAAEHALAYTFAKMD
jgi:hypothetical protein